MIEPHGPLDRIPLENYPPQLTIANYMAIKQMIDQVINEDQEYVNWKLKNQRTGGTLDKYLYSYKLEEEYERENREKINEAESKVLKPGDFYDMPKGMKFPRDIYDDQLRQLPRPRMLDQQQVRKLFVDHLDEEQMNRYEVFKRASLAKNQIKKISSVVTNQTVAANVNLLLGGIGKLLVGEIVEKALDVKQKWLLSMMVNKFHERKVIGNKLKKHLKKLTILVGTASGIDDEVDEEESDSYYDDDKEETAFVLESNKLLKSSKNTEEIRVRIIKQYNILVTQFNKLNVSVEKYINSPLLPEHIHEAWRLYRLENDTVLSAHWRTQGEGNGLLFR
ncbi:HFL217Cp [Eremothecium sinecaudum]|uniref:HFL217Cp n=1 Tax=Eremothecium sinecaudum TaxID=45286 RepID=A0A0X8HUG4_9SACH|nr:HFL217Cp [Eremothecium sinecaudum]AMD21639.1 HFL217Cp [Eremothecium sinecaudum]